MSVDLRTRTDGPQPPVDPEDFFGRELPELLDARAAAVLPGARLLALIPLTLETAGETWTLQWAGTRVDIRRGVHDGGAHVRLAPGQLDDLVHDQGTPTGWRSSGRLDQPAGTIADVLDWWLVLRAALDDRPGAGHVWGKRTFNRIEALFKPIGVVEGISDVPWHKDCALGRHSYDCCALTVGISVTGADAESGQLRVLAGSHRALIWPQLRQPHCDLPEVDLPTRTGDVTLHLSCTLHMAQPPVTHERRVLYTGFGLPDRNTEAA